jgi:hypothetical protein
MPLPQTFSKILLRFRLFVALKAKLTALETISNYFKLGGCYILDQNHNQEMAMTATTILIMLKVSVLIKHMEDVITHESIVKTP